MKYLTFTVELSRSQSIFYGFRFLLAAFSEKVEVTFRRGKCYIPIKEEDE